MEGHTIINKITNLQFSLLPLLNFFMAIPVLCSLDWTTCLPSPLMINLQLEFKPHLLQKTCPEHTCPPQILNTRCSPVITTPEIFCLFDFSKWYGQQDLWIKHFSLLLKTILGP